MVLAVIMVLLSVLVYVTTRRSFVFPLACFDTRSL